ncbi:TPA: reverse transcriptase domain-containing protein [Serratia marcescens]|uniref:reverse transcriptase domain-containing protein n=1 Tax=Serratia marcescens TaxID=615 RepID=UPI001115443C|nr:reverse transcriptase domain-containing protein [Serratia marcescens]
MQQRRAQLISARQTPPHRVKPTPSPGNRNNDRTLPFTTAQIDAAYQWLIKQRQHYPDNADIWHLRFHWLREREEILSSLNRGEYRFSPLHLIQKTNGESLALWTSRDALVLKMLTAVLTPLLPVHPLCEHVRGHGGGRQSTRRVHHHLRDNPAPFVFRTDIRGYYAAIDKQRLYTQLTGRVTHPILLSLLWQFLHYSVESGGNFHTPKRGISRGAALSPLLAAFHLYDLDSAFGAQSRVRYVRYMDDFLILAPTRWSLRRAVAQLKHALYSWGFTLHPDKTQLGRTEQGFDWMGLWFRKDGVQSIAPRAVEKHRLQCRRLYERIRHLNSDVQAARMAMYRRRWVGALWFPPTPLIVRSADALPLVFLLNLTNSFGSSRQCEMGPGHLIF